MSERFAYGDRVRHTARPEWGTGSVIKAEDLPVNGQASQRVSVRFPGVGLKVLNTSHAELARAEAPQNGVEDVSFWDEMKGDWLGPVAARKIEEHMIALPEAARDPFASIRSRLEFMLGLYRFDRTGRGLVDWAVAQTGLDDPLSRFNRHELERFFDRWTAERDAQLSRLIHEAGEDRTLVDELLAQAPPSAKKAARRGGAPARP